MILSHCRFQSIFPARSQSGYNPRHRQSATHNPAEEILNFYFRSLTRADDSDRIHEHLDSLCCLCLFPCYLSRFRGGPYASYSSPVSRRSCRSRPLSLHQPLRETLVAETPETSRFTSVYERIQELNALRGEPAGGLPEAEPTPRAARCDLEAVNRGSSADAGSKPASAGWLSPFELSEAGGAAPVPSVRASNKGCLPMTFAEYLNLLDWTGRQLRQDKRGAIPQDLAPILERLHVSDEGWMQLMGRFSRLFRRAAGRPQSMLSEGQQRGCRLMQGIRHSRAIFL